jgi:glycerol-3-phosphate dehydrogenase
MYNPPRVALSVLKSAVEAGAAAANYVEVAGFRRRGDRVCGVEARDLLTRDSFTIRGRMVLNAAGPWAEGLIQVGLGLPLTPPCTYSRDACFVVGRPWSSRYALAVQGRTRDPDAIVSRKARHLFIVPWRDYTLVGVWHVVYEGDPGRFTVTEEDLQGFLDEVNDAYPPLALKRTDVSLWNAGIVLFGENEPGATHLSYGKRSRIIDHVKQHGIEGLVSLIGVRYTTALAEADKAIALVFSKLGRTPPKSATALTPIYGGEIERFGELLDGALAERPHGLADEVLRSLVHNYGSEYRRVLSYVRENPDWGEALGGSKVIRAEVVHAVREEMAEKLGDVVFRRTDLGTGAHPGEEAIATSAELMAAELGWGSDRTQAEIEEVEGVFPSLAGSRAVPR